MDKYCESIFKDAENFKINIEDTEEDDEQDRVRLNKEIGDLVNGLDNVSLGDSDEDDYIVTDEASRTNYRYEDVQNINQKENSNGFLSTSIVCSPLHYGKENDSMDTHYTMDGTEKIIDQKHEHLKILFDKEQKQNVLYKNTIDLLNNENEQLKSSYQQCHELLVETKARLLENEVLVTKMKGTIVTLKARNSELDFELNNVKTILSDTQLKLDVIHEKKTTDAKINIDAMLKQTNDRNNILRETMQQQINVLRQELINKDIEFENINGMKSELQSTNNYLLIEKSKMLSDMTTYLKEIQLQYHNIINRSNLIHKNQRLKVIVSSCEQQLVGIQKTIDDLICQHQLVTNKQLGAIITDINGIKRIDLKKDFIDNTPIGLFNTIIQYCLAEDNVLNELHSCMTNLKCKTEENILLSDKLGKCTREIKLLKCDENKALVELNNFKDTNFKMENKIKNLETQLEYIRENLKHSQYIKTTPIPTLNGDDLTNTRGNVINSNCMRESNHFELSSENIILNNNILISEKCIVDDIKCNCIPVADNSSMELERNKFFFYHIEREANQYKNFYIVARNRLCGSLSGSEQSNNCVLEVAEADRNKISNKEKYYGVFGEEIHKNSGICENYTNQGNYKMELDLSIVVGKKREDCLKDQMSIGCNYKANGFGKFNLKDFNTSCKLLLLLKPNEKKTNLSQNMNDVLLYIAKQTLNDSACFSCKIKQLKIKHQNQFKSLENNICILESKIKQSDKLLDVKTSEVTALKQAILLERGKISAILRNKDNETRLLFERQNNVLRKYREQFESSQKLTYNLNNKILEMRTKYEGDLLLLKETIRNSTTENLKLRQKQNDLIAAINKIEGEKRIITEQWKKKYIVAKKTASSYKKYAEDKDEHIINENERIKLAYKTAITNIQKSVEEKLRSEQNLDKFKLPCVPNNVNDIN